MAINDSLKNPGITRKTSQALFRRSLLHGLAEKLNQPKDADLDQLTEWLGNQAQALDLAWRYMGDQVWVPASTYLAELKNTAAHLPPAVQTWADNASASKAHRLAAVFLLTLKILAGKGETNRLARQTLSVAACCAAEKPIPADWLERAVMQKNNPPAFEQGLRRLYQLGLLIPTDQGPVMHALLGEITRPAAPIDVITLRGLAQALVDPELSRSQEQFPGQEAVLCAHLERVIPLAEQAGLEEAGDLYYRTGRLFWEGKEIDKALVCFQRSLAYIEKSGRLETQEGASRLEHLGSAWFELQKYDRAKECYEGALKIEEKIFSEHYPITADYRLHLGKTLLELKDLLGAKQCFEQALSIYKNAFGYGPKHARVAESARLLGKTLEKLKDLPGARDCYQRALEIDESIFVFGPDHPQVAEDASDLGRVLYALDRLPAAKACFERILAIYEKAPDANQTRIAAALYMLGNVLAKTGELQKAQTCLERALAIDEKNHGPQELQVARDLNCLGGILQDQQDSTGAKVCFERALTIDQTVNGMGHPRVARDVNNLGTVLKDLGDRKGAEACFTRALVILITALEPGEPEVCAVRENLNAIKILSRKKSSQGYPYPLHRLEYDLHRENTLA